MPETYDNAYIDFSNDNTASRIDNATEAKNNHLGFALSAALLGTWAASMACSIAAAVYVGKMNRYKLEGDKTNEIKYHDKIVDCIAANAAIGCGALTIGLLGTLFSAFPPKHGG